MSVSNDYKLIQYKMPGIYCGKCRKEFDSLKSLGNHKRWCLGKMEHARLKLSRDRMGDKNPAKRQEVRDKIRATLKSKPKLPYPNCLCCGEILGHRKRKRCRDCFNKSKIGKPNFKIRGENHPGWKGGITPINLLIRNSVEYKRWRLTILKRDRYKCVLCGKTNAKGINAKLNVDHIKPFSEYPELRFTLTNGRTLCEECHKKTPTYGRKKLLK